MSGTVSRRSLSADARAHTLLDLYVLYKLADRSVVVLVYSSIPASVFVYCRTKTALS